MVASKSQIVLALWIATMLAGTIRAADRRSLLACDGTKDSLGLTDCGCTVYKAAGAQPVMGSDLVSGCPHDGQKYAVCMGGNAKGGCKLESQGLFAPADCAFSCWFQSAVSASAPQGVATKLPICGDPSVKTQPGTPVATPNCPQDGQDYQACLQGNAMRGCRALSAGPWPTADCSVVCLFNSGSASG
ncbi:hypothetical protein COCOBI_18-1460 [Coccomyxa sp. Obi]|nr:hypothetical protein COCOBI_18-1460 [Coccomyxa sp. Obi]